MSTTPSFSLPTLPDQKKALAMIKPLREQAALVTIKDEDSFIAAWSLIERHDAAIAKIGEMFDPFVNALHKLHKMAIDLRNEFLFPVVNSKARIMSERKVFRAEQERLKRLEDEKNAEILRKAQAKELEREAKKIEKAGDKETAAVLREQAKTMPAPAIAPTLAVPKQQGSVITKKWKFEITHPDLVPREYCEPMPSKIRKVVEALGDKVTIPGIRIYFDETESSRKIST